VYIQWFLLHINLRSAVITNMIKHQINLVIKVFHKLISLKLSSCYLLSTYNSLLIIYILLIIYVFQAKELHETLQADVSIETIFTCT